MQACVGSGLRACVGTGQAYFLLTAPNNPGREVRQAHRQRTGWAKRTGRVEHEQPEPTGAGAAGGATPRPTTLDSSLRPEVPNEHPMTRTDNETNYMQQGDHLTQGISSEIAQLREELTCVSPTAQRSGVAADVVLGDRYTSSVKT